MTIVSEPALVVRVILPSWIVLMLVRYVFVPLRARDKLPGLFMYMLFYECCLYWIEPLGPVHGPEPELGDPPGHGARA